MELIPTTLNDSFVLQPKIFADERGYFFESFNKNKFKEISNLNINFVQDNQAKSNKGVLRGLHYQIGESAQAKLVSVLHGSVLDVIVDMRKNSETFGQHFKIVLSAENKLQLFVPRGFAHGYIVLQDNTEFFYKCDNFYNKESEAGVIYNDVYLNIDWKLNPNEFIISEKDIQLPSFENSIYFT